MDEKTAADIQAKCLDKMKQGGLTPEERMACFDEFETTIPSREAVQAFYDLWGKDYDVDMSVAGYKNPVDVSDEMDKLFGDKKYVKILDVGAGTGEGGKKLVDLGFTNIDATDGSKGMLDLAVKLNIYRNVYHELLVEGEPMKTIPEGSYDVVVSSGSFYPFHLKGGHLRCIVNLAKKGGMLILSSCPNDDKHVGIRPVIKELQEEGTIEVVKELYVPKWYLKDDGTVWVMKKL